MQRRARRALLVPLAVLAGCSLAGPDGSACINWCYCNSSGSTAPPEPSPFLRPILPSRGPRTLLGAARIFPRGECDTCALQDAHYYNKKCPGKFIDVLDKVNEQWNNGGIIYVNISLAGDENRDPCRGEEKTLHIFVKSGTSCDVNHNCEDVGFAARGVDKTVIDLRDVTAIGGQKYECCAPSGKKML